MIEAVDVANRVFEWWRDGVMHGDFEVQHQDGDKSGKIPWGPRRGKVWSQRDIVERACENDWIPRPAGQEVEGFELEEAMRF